MMRTGQRLTADMLSVFHGMTLVGVTWIFVLCSFFNLYICVLYTFLLICYSSPKTKNIFKKLLPGLKALLRSLSYFEIEENTFSVRLDQ